MGGSDCYGLQVFSTMSGISKKTWQEIGMENSHIWYGKKRKAKRDGEVLSALLSDKIHCKGTATGISSIVVTVVHEPTLSTVLAVLLVMCLD